MNLLVTVVGCPDNNHLWMLLFDPSAMVQSCLAKHAGNSIKRKPPWCLGVQHELWKWLSLKLSGHVLFITSSWHNISVKHKIHYVYTLKTIFQAIQTFISHSATFFKPGYPVGFVYGQMPGPEGYHFDCGCVLDQHGRTQRVRAPLENRHLHFVNFCCLLEFWKGLVICLLKMGVRYFLFGMVVSA